MEWYRYRRGSGPKRIDSLPSSQTPAPSIVRGCTGETPGELLVVISEHANEFRRNEGTTLIAGWHGRFQCFVHQLRLGKA